MYKLTFLILLLTISNCQSIISSDDPRLDEEFEIGFGEQVSLDNGSLSIEFKEVVEDSRCPEGVACFWAGNALVALVLNDNETELNTYLEPQETKLSVYHVDLISLSPYPVYEQIIEKEDYVVKLLVAKE
jgi:hypothetical protein